MKQKNPCTEYREQLAARQEAPVPSPSGSQLAPLLEHLEECDECRALEQALAKLPALFEPLRSELPPEHLLERTLAAVPQPSRNASMHWALRVAAGLIGFLLVSPLIRRQASDVQPESLSPATSALFIQIGHNLGAAKVQSSTPEQALLAHMTSPRGEK